MRYRYLYYFLFLLPVFIFRDYTPTNELKYISIAEEAIQNNTWFTFYNHGEAYADKPPLFIWLIMFSKLISGGYYMWIIGLFSLLPAIGIMAIMDRWLKNENIKFNPLISNLLLLTTAMFLASALVVRMDMLMTLFIVLSLYTFYDLYKDKRSNKDLIPIYIFLALFTKGPMGILIPVASIIAFLIVKKQFRTLSRYLGWRQWGILFALCLIWFGCVYMEGGKEYLDNLLIKQTIGRGVNSFHHKQPFWFYFPRMLWSFAPWTFLYIGLIWLGVRKKIIKKDVEKFFLTIIVTSIFMLSLISSKLDIYLLPVYPFIVYLCSGLLIQNQNSKVVKIAVAIPAIALILSLSATIIYKDKIPELHSCSSIVHTALVILAISEIIAILMLYKKQVQQAIVFISSGVIALAFISAFAIPKINKYIGLGEMAKAANHTELTDILYTCYKFDTALNMNIYLNKNLKKVDSITELEILIESGQKTILFIRNKELQRDKELFHWLTIHNPEWSVGDYCWYLLGNEE